MSSAGTGRPDSGGIAAGVLFVLVGLAFLLEELGVWTLRLRYVLPLVLIGIGLAILISWLVSVARSAHE